MTPKAMAKPVAYLSESVRGPRDTNRSAPKLELASVCGRTLTFNVDLCRSNGVGNGFSALSRFFFDDDLAGYAGCLRHHSLLGGRMGFDCPFPSTLR